MDFKSILRPLAEFAAAAGHQLDKLDYEGEVLSRKDAERREALGLKTQAESAQTDKGLDQATYG